MKILINTFGSRGDIQPFIALGKGLQRAGHDVLICTAEGFRAFVEGHGLPYAHMDNAMYEMMQSQTGKAAMEGSKGVWALYKQVGPMIRRALDDEWTAAQAYQPDLIVHHPKSLGSYAIAEKLNLPLVLALPLPLYTPTRAYPVPMFGGNLWLGGWFNRMSYSLLRLANVAYAKQINDFRTTVLGLPAQSRFADSLRRADGAPVPVLYPYSPHVLPVPPDYPPHVHVTGDRFLDQASDWQPPTALVDFLQAGPPPVYVGFGSMSGTRGEARAQMVVDALTQAGQRGVLVSGWGGLEAATLPANILMLPDLPHDSLFPRMAAVVHHGGAGTTAAGLRAGKPTLICPFIADQPFWGRVIHDLGVGPAPIPQKQLTTAKLAAAMHTLTRDAPMQQRAADLGAKIREESGVANAIRVLEEIQASFGS